MTFVSRSAALACAAAVLATLCACGGGGHQAGSSPSAHTPPVSAGSTPPQSPSTSPVAAQTPKNPYTGLGPVPKTPTIAVKIDDTAPGRPQVGIDQADVVYVEAAEGGLTRLAAIYGTVKPRAVGYVRSTRPSDPDLLLQYGKITEAYSGGAHDSLPRVYRSGIKSWSNDAGAAYYSRVDRAASDYINLVLDVNEVAAHTRSAKAKSIGWTFDDSLAGVGPLGKGTDVRTTVTGSYAPPAGTPVEFRWDAKLGKYVRYIDGVRQVTSTGAPVDTTNVVVQSCKVVSHPQDTDVDGNPSQFTYTVGTGPVSIFRDGKRVDGTWTRSKLDSGTVFTTAAGKVIPLHPGNTWVVLIRKGVAVSG